MWPILSGNSAMDMEGIDSLSFPSIFPLTVNRDGEMLDESHLEVTFTDSMVCILTIQSEILCHFITIGL